MLISEYIAPHRGLALQNLEATGNGHAMDRLAVWQERLLPPGAVTCLVDTVATPEDIIPEALIISQGGDGTVRRSEASIIGLVPNNPQETTRNLEKHRAIAASITYASEAGGNANNYARSALGLAAIDPNKLNLASLGVIAHRPLIYKIERNNETVLDAVTSCIGFQGPELAAEALQAAKPQLNQLRERPLGEQRRLLREGMIALRAAYQAPASSFEVAQLFDNGTARFDYYHDATGLELIGSQVYAKQGRTTVNIEDPFWQPVATERKANRAHDLAAFLGSMARLKFGRHVRPVYDLRNSKLAITNTGENTVRYHADGETDPRYTLGPEETMYLSLAKIAVPVLVAR